MGEQTTVIGTVLSVIFQNEENGYTVARITTDDGEVVTVVGCMPCLATGENLIATGRYVSHPSYGEQFAADEIERHMPSGETEILNYLSSGAIRGVGPSTAQKLVDRFGERTLDILENEPEQLQVVRGLTARRAKEIGEAFREQMGLRRTMEFLLRYDLPVALSIPLYRRFGAGAAAAIRQNPYLLCAEPFGVPFSDADEIALSIGIDDPSRRTEAALLFELAHNERSGGHVFVPREKLLAATAQLLDASPDETEKSLDDLITRGEIVQEHIADVDACYLKINFEAERYAAIRLRAMLADTPDRLSGVEKTIDEIEKEQGITYAPLQRTAVELAAQEELLLLTGGPGTGKTTAVRGIVALFGRMGLNVLLCAPTGRAAKRMGELCGREGQTIHRLLEMRFDERSGEPAFSRDESNPLDADAVVVDETSMVDLQLLCALLRALRPGTRLVFVGDADQLPSVGAGNVFSDLIRSGKIATVALTEVFRQAEQSAIVRNAHRVNAGEVPELSNASASADFFFLPRRDPERMADTVVELCRSRLPEKMGISAEEIQVLSPTRKGPGGTAALNRALQAAINPPSPDKREIPWGDIVFRVGDRVMQTRNDYDAVWEKESGEAGTGIFNGDVGRIVSIDPSGTLLEVVFDDRKAVYSAEMLAELDIAYAITVHKAQGSEYRAVILAATHAAPTLMVRSVLYTGITRARELLVIVGDDTAVCTMAENERKTRRYSGLRRRIMEDEK